MHIVTARTGFTVDGFVATEAPLTYGLFNGSAFSAGDLKALFSFPAEHRDAMPFYAIPTGVAERMAETLEGVYGALWDAVEWLSRNRWAVPEYFGKEFCERYPQFINYALWTFTQGHEAVYGRFDAALDPVSGDVTGVYEFNGNTPVMLFESTVLQNWLTERANAASPGARYDQFNQFYEATQRALPKLLGLGRKTSAHVGIVLFPEYVEDAVTCEVLHQLFASHPDVTVSYDHIDNIGFDMLPGRGPSFTLNGAPLTHVFALQPWEEIVESCYHDVIARWQEWGDKTRFFEPAWRWFMANKGIWALVTHLLETDDEYRSRHGDLPLLATYMAPDVFIEAGAPYAEKPLVGRLSNNVVLYKGDGSVEFASGGAYEDYPCVYQTYCAPGRLAGRNNFIAGMWMAAYDDPEPHLMTATSLCIREFDLPVLDIANERFVPHLLY